MTGFGSTIAAFLAGGAVALGGLLAGHSDAGSSRAALVIDADAGRDGRELVDSRLRDSDVQIRLPRTDGEARTDLRYLEAQGYRVVVSGPIASAAARATGVAAVRAPDVTGALAAVSR
jgi:hypothetical protein